MKKIYFLTALCLHFALGQAATYKAAVINLKSGAQINYALENLDITHQNKKLIVTSPKANAEFNLSDVASFEVKEIKEVATYLSEVKDFFVQFDGENKTLSVNHYTGRVDLFFPGGQLRQSFNVKEGEAIDLSNLPQALYICLFRANGQTLKIVTK